MIGDSVKYRESLFIRNNDWLKVKHKEPIRGPAGWVPGVWSLRTLISSLCTERGIATVRKKWICFLKPCFLKEISIYSGNASQKWLYFNVHNNQNVSIIGVFLGMSNWKETRGSVVFMTWPEISNREWMDGWIENNHNDYPGIILFSSRDKWLQHSTQVNGISTPAFDGWYIAKLNTIHEKNLKNWMKANKSRTIG